MLPGLYQMLRSASFVSSESLKADLKQFSSDQGYPHGRVISACRYAITGGLVRTKNSNNTLVNHWLPVPSLY